MKLLTKPGCFHTKFHGLVKAWLRGRRSGIQAGPRIAADLQSFSNLIMMMMMITVAAVATMMNRVVVFLGLKRRSQENGVLATVHGLLLSTNRQSSEQPKP